LVIRTASGILHAVDDVADLAKAQPGLDDTDIIRLSVPGTLRYRDLVLRVVTSSCKLVRALATVKQEARPESQDFEDKVVSAVGEAFNNVAIHAYRDVSPEAVEFEIEVSADGITLRMSDTGRAFEPMVEVQRQPDLATLPESHMGLYIMRSCMDKVTYRPGVSRASHVSRGSAATPNLLTLTKRFQRP
jgi:anti-sigma regulatory factor (Ser/Thr protein kinase)